MNRSNNTQSIETDQGFFFNLHEISVSRIKYRMDYDVSSSVAVEREI